MFLTFLHPPEFSIERYHLAGLAKYLEEFYLLLPKKVFLLGGASPAKVFRIPSATPVKVKNVSIQISLEHDEFNGVRRAYITNTTHTNTLWTIRSRGKFMIRGTRSKDLW